MSTPTRRAYGELDRDEVVSALQALAQRVGVQKVTMRGLAAELGAAVPSVYYHVPGKQAALDLLAESVLSGIGEPPPGPWDRRLVEMFCESREVLLDVPGIAAILHTNGDGECARILDRRSRDLIAQSGLSESKVNAAHAVLYTYLLGSVSLEESRPPGVPVPTKRQAAARYRAGLDVILAGIKASVEDR
jgi:TetR/AcrR family transcriptional regulator, tetracycline repressor protein